MQSGPGVINANEFRMRDVSDEWRQRVVISVSCR